MEGLGDLAQLLDIVSHGLVIVVAEDGADGTIHVDMEHGQIGLICTVGQDTVTQPSHIVSQLLAVLAQLVFHIVDQSVGQNLSALDDHLVSAVVTVITGLGENVNGGFGHGAAVLICHDFAHQSAGGLGNGIQNGLGHTVADGGVQALAFHLDGFHHGSQRTEVIGFLAHQLGLDVLVDDGNEVLGQEQRITSAGAGILNGSAVAHGDLAVLQDQHDRNGLTGLTDGGEALGHGSAYIEHTVVTGAALDGALVVEIEAGTATGANNINNFHGNNLLYVMVINTWDGPPNGPYRWRKHRQQPSGRKPCGLQPWHALRSWKHGSPSAPW